MIKKLTILLIPFLLLVGCSSQKQSDKLTIVTTTLPIFDFASKISGDDANVVTVGPRGDSHEYEPSPQDIATITKADIFIYNGLGFEHWVEKVLKSVNNPDLVIIDASKGIDAMSTEYEDHEGHDHEAHDHGLWDPHVWMSPVNAKIQARNVFDAISSVDKVHTENYEVRFETLSHQFDLLNQRTKDVLEPNRGKTITVEHAAFGYLLTPYEIKQDMIKGNIASEEPTIKEMNEAINTIKSNNTKIIYMEVNGNRKLMDVLVRETGVEILTLNTLEGVPKTALDESNDYFAKMNENLNVLEKGFSK